MEHIFRNLNDIHVFDLFSEMGFNKDEAIDIHDVIELLECGEIERRCIANPSTCPHFCGSEEFNFCDDFNGKKCQNFLSKVEYETKYGTTFGWDKCYKTF